MIFPSINDISQDNKYNKYTLVIAAAKCARLITDEYVLQREVAEKRIANKETDKPLASMIKKEYRDEKAVKNAVRGLYDGRFKIVGEADDVDEADGEEDISEETVAEEE